MTDISAPWTAGGAGVSPRSMLKLLLLAFALRLVWALLIPVVPESDGHAYDRFARTLVEHGVFGWTKDDPFAFWPPGTSMLYAAVYWVAGFDYRYIVAVNLVLALALVALTVRLASRFYGPAVGFWSGAVVAVWPTMVMLTTLLVSEQLFLVLVLWAIDCWTRPTSHPVRSAVAAGLLLGAATLVRPIAMLLPLVLAGGLWLQAGFDRGTFLQQLRMGVVASVAMACLIAPWTLRNYHLYDAFIPVSTNGGVTLWMGNAPGSDGYMIDLPPEVLGLSDYETEKILGARAREYIAADPLGFVLRTAKKLVLLYNNESIGALWNTGGIESRFGEGSVTGFKRFTQVTWAMIFLLALAGAWIAAKRLGAWRLLLSPMVLVGLYFSLVHAVVLTGDRYHLVAAGAVASLAGFALATAAARHRLLRPLGA